MPSMPSVSALHRQLADRLLRNAVVTTRQAPDYALNYGSRDPSLDQATQILQDVARGQRELTLDTLVAMRGARQTPAMRGAADDVARAVSVFEYAAGTSNHHRLRASYEQAEHLLEMAHTRRMAANGLNGHEMSNRLTREDYSMHNLRAQVLGAASTPQARVDLMIRALAASTPAP